MEINFVNKSIDTYREISHQVKRIQESAESVVPDVNDDIGRIASVQTAVLLKSKDISSRGVLVSGEASASLLYVTEDEANVSFVKLTKHFAMEFENVEVAREELAQINLRITNTETRIINPRKVSVTMEITGELSAYSTESLKIAAELPDNICPGFYARFESAEAVIPNAVCEKTYTLNEQFSFPSGKPAPSQLVSQKVDFAVNETQLIGTKLVIKGNVIIDVCYLSADCAYPLYAQFSGPFSQIVDIGCDVMDNCTVIIELSSAYFDITDTISGEKALDAELHAVIQIVSRSRQKLRYVSDAYSNLMPAVCCVDREEINSVSDMLRAKLNADERISVVEDCSDVLSIFAECTQPVIDETKLKASVCLDIIYRTKTGALSSARRMLELEGESLAAPSRVLKYRLSDVYLRPDGAFIDAHISVELIYESSSVTELMRVSTVELCEEETYDFSSFASLSLVRVENESLWELAKKYHSSVEIIREMNDTEQGLDGKLLLIPKLA